MENTKVLLQGVAGSYSHIFAKSLGYTDIDFVKTFDEVIDKIQKGEYEYGILPDRKSVV